MAKAKKTTDETNDAAAETPKKAPAKRKAPGAAASQPDTAPAASAAKKPATPAKKPAAKPTAGGHAFGIDTNLAAQSAARMLLNRPSTPAPTGPSKSLKDTLGKQSTPNLNNLLGGGPTGSAKSSNLPHFGGQQKGHNQATGHVGNTGVPRRTPG